MSGVLTLLGGGSLVGICGAGFGSAIAPAATSVYYRTLLAVRDRIAGLNLAGLAAESVTVKKLAIDRHWGVPGGLDLPAVLITPAGEQTDPHAGTNLQDEVVYAVRVLLIDRDNQEPTLQANLERCLRWREQIARALRNQRLLGVAEIYTVRVEPGEVIELGAWTKNLLVSALMLKFVSREPRGG